MSVKSVSAVHTRCPVLKILNAIGEAVLGSVAIISMYAYSLDFIPEPYNSLVLGGGAGLLTATVIATQAGRGKSQPIGEVGQLPGVPEKRRGRAPEPEGRSVEKELLLRKYDRAFQHMLSRHGPTSRLHTIEKMKPIIYELSPEIKAWTGDLRIRVYLLMQEIAKDLDDPAYAKASLGLLVLILSKGGSAALEMARPLFREKIQAMYLDTKYDNERFLPRLLLMLEDYEPNRIESMAKEAIHVWGDERFSAACEYLGFEELRARGVRSRVKGMLGEEIARAGVNGDRTALDRAVELYHNVV